MALFAYKAVDTRGKTMLGQIEAINLVDLELRLKRMGLDLVRGGPTRYGGSLLRSGDIKRAELINFCFHMEQLIAAGVPLVESLIDLRDSIENARFREVMSGVIESIQGGLRLSQSLAQYPKIFNPVFTSLVRAGEDTGRLADVLKSLVENLKWEDELAEHMKKLVLSRFASIFALMSSSGITILDAIRSSEKITGNMVIQEGLRLAGQQIGEGKNVTAAFQEVGLFPPLVVRMLRVGEATGALDKALLNVSYFYNREVRESIGKIQVIIEPALTVVLGVILGWEMLSVLGPIYDVISQIKI